jgi:hypothetical protein
MSQVLDLLSQWRLTAAKDFTYQKGFAQWLAFFLNFLKFFGYFMD